ncbi:MAG: hypothetical protein ACXWQ5_00250 [Ktedonobacterales bacterium]
MSRLDRAMGRRRDLPQLESTGYAALAAGTATDPAQDTVIGCVPELRYSFLGAADLNQGQVSALPLNSMVVRVASFISQGAANTVANATNNCELRLNAYRAGVLQGAIGYYPLSVNTTITQAVTAGNAGTVQTITLASMTGVKAGMALLIDTAGSAELVYVQAVSATAITAYFAKAHTSGVAATTALLPFRPVNFLLLSGASTTATTSVGAPGSVTITPASIYGIRVGMQLQISGGTGTAEVVTVTAVTATTFTATFANTHSGTYNVVSTGTATGPFELLPGDVVAVQRISNNVTGLATPAGIVQLEWVPSKLLQ